MPESSLRVRLHEHLHHVEERIAAACRRAGRDRSEVTLVAVTKMVTAEVAALLHELGVVDLGESRPQALWKKAGLLPSSVRWHLIGHLQRNKVERTLPLVQVIHSVDSVRLLGTVDEQAGCLGRRLPVLLEVNASGEANKHGFPPDQVTALAPSLRNLANIDVVGLMTMAAFQDSEACRPTFARLRELRDRMAHELGDHPLTHLSMGMSNDFEVAIEEGATLVRLGSVLFEGVDA